MKQLFKKIDGLNIECLVSAGTGAPVFIFHGNSSCAAAYADLLNSPLGDQYQIIAVSFPGHGASDYYRDDREWLSIATLGEFTAQVVRAFNAERYLLVGQSLGGHALLEALELHTRATGLCLISAPPFSLTTIGNLFREDPTGGLLFANQLDDAGVEQFARAFVHHDNPAVKRQLQLHIRNTHGKFREDLGKSLAKGLLEDEITALAHANIPTWLLQGKEDQFLNNDYYAALLREPLPIKLISFEDCGHAIQFDAAERFQQTIASFIVQHIPREQNVNPLPLLNSNSKKELQDA